MGRYGIITLLISTLFFYIHHSVHATPSERVLLQQYLTIVEVDRDLSRVKEEEGKLETELKVNQDKRIIQEEIVKELRAKGAIIVREYYTGERISWVSMLFSMESFHHGILMIEYLFEIFDRDMTELQQAYEAYQSLLTLQQEMEQQHTDLIVLINHYAAQKNRLQSLEQSLNTSLENIPERERLEKLMKQLEDDWLQKGRPTFELFFNQLAVAIEKFPTIIKKDNINLKGLNPKVTINDQEINEFLSSENPLFKQLTFSFRDDEMWVQGIHEDIALTIVGSYKKVSDESLAFNIHQMTYDGFFLPDTTVEQMERSIDLGFYPAYIHPNFRIKSYSMSDHQLQLELKFAIQ